MNARLDRLSRCWVVGAALSALLPLTLTLPLDSQLAIGVCAGIGGLAAWSARPLPWLLRLALTGFAVLAVLWLFGIGVRPQQLGRDAGSALLACMLGLKLMELTTTRDARAAVSFGLFALMAAFLQEEGPVTLLLALGAGLVALATLVWLAEREYRPLPPALDLPRRLRAAGRLVVISLPLAMVGFFLFPRLASPLWGLPQNSEQGKTGLSDDMSPGDIAQLFADDSPILRVSFDGPVPAPELRYFRGPVLSQFDGRRWTRSLWSGDTVAAEAQPRGELINYEIEQEPTDRHNLLALDLPFSVPEGAQLTRERHVLSRSRLTKLSRQRFQSAVGYVFEPTLDARLRRNLLALPEGFNPRSVALGREWAATLGDPLMVINASLGLFNREFTYTLRPGLLGRDPVDDFLFEQKRGYCEHFSSAFVVLMRAAGIPARVVTGYQGGYVNPLGNYLVVAQSDAHAWSEVWLDGRGWVRVDPTSAVSPERIEYGREALLSASAWRDYVRPMLNAADWMRRGWNDFVLGYDAKQQKMLLQPFGIDNANWRDIGIALALAAGAALAITFGLLLRRPRDRRHPIVRAWEHFLRRMARHGLARLAWEAPNDFANRIAPVRPHDGEIISNLCARYSRWQYAPNSRDEEINQALLRDLKEFRPSNRKQ